MRTEVRHYCFPCRYGVKNRQGMKYGRKSLYMIWISTVTNCFGLVRNLRQIVPYSQLLLSCISAQWSARKVQRYMNFVHYTFRLYPAQSFSKLLSLAFGAKNPFCCKDAASTLMCVGWERWGEPWGSLQSIYVTAMPICSKKILWGRLGCCCVLYFQNEIKI